MELQKNNVDAILLFDPLNIRYATGTSNMLLWNTHNPFRSCLVLMMGTVYSGTIKKVITM